MTDRRPDPGQLRRRDRNEFQDHKGFTSTTLLPGVGRDQFLPLGGRGRHQGRTGEKADRADVAKDGWNALKAGEDNKVSD